MIRLISIDLGKRKIQIPVFEKTGVREGPNLLVTAGMDGDEYAGIEAAYRLIEIYRNKEINGNLIVLPIVNVPGFEKAFGINPLDNKLPKWIMSGKKNGSPSEKLIWTIYDHYISRSDYWVDLHGGGLTEYLEPYVYLYETGIEKLNIFTQDILEKIRSPKIVYEKKGVWSKTEFLAKKDIFYMISEAGYAGLRDEIYIRFHINNIQTVMKLTGMISGNIKKKVKKRIYRRIYSVWSNMDGLWHPSGKKMITEDDLLGVIYSTDRKISKTIKSKFNGEFLYFRQSMPVVKGDLLIDIGTSLMRK